MYHGYTYEAALAASLRAQWKLDDVLAPDQELDFTRSFLPEPLARTAEAPGLDRNEQRILNQICALQYLCFFGVVEEFILPFVMDHARPMLRENDFRARALLNFANEEAKHVHLFRRFREAFERGFPVHCEIVGPSDTVGQRVLGHHPLAVALFILMIEWMTQGHYVESARDDGNIDSLFKSLLKHHWMEEAQHAKLDTLIADALAERRSHQEIAGVMNELFAICKFMDNSMGHQSGYNVDALERATGRKVKDRDRVILQQHRAARWTYLGSGLVHENFQATLNHISPKAAQAAAAMGARVKELADTPV